MTPRQTIALVSERSGVDVLDILGSSRKHRVTNARHMAMYVCRAAHELSFPEIGRLFKRDHSTVQVACARVEEKVKTNPRHAEDIFDLVNEAHGEARKGYAKVRICVAMRADGSYVALGRGPARCDPNLDEELQREATSCAGGDPVHISWVTAAVQKPRDEEIKGRVEDVS